MLFFIFCSFRVIFLNILWKDKVVMKMVDFICFFLELFFLLSFDIIDFIGRFWRGVGLMLVLGVFFVFFCFVDLMNVLCLVCSVFCMFIEFILCLFKLFLFFLNL